MTAAALLLAFSVGASNPGTFFTGLGFDHSSGGVAVDARYTPLGSDSNRVTRLDVNAARGFQATLDALCERAIFPILFRYEPLAEYPAAGGKFEIPADFFRHDWTNNPWATHASVENLPFAYAADRFAFSENYYARIFPRAMRYLRNAERYIRNYATDGGQPYLAIPVGSSMFGSMSNDVFSTNGALVPTGSVAKAACDFLQTSCLNLYDTPDINARHEYDPYVYNAVNSFFYPTNRIYAASLKRIDEYQKQLAADMGLTLRHGIIEGTNRWTRISTEELGRLNTFLALWDKSFVDGSVPVYTNEETAVVLTYIHYLKGSATALETAKRNDDGSVSYWNVTLEEDEDAMIPGEGVRTNGWNTTSVATAKISDIDKTVDGLVLGSTPLHLPKSVLIDAAGYGTPGSTITGTLTTYQPDPEVRKVYFLISLAGRSEHTALIDMSTFDNLTVEGSVKVIAQATFYLPLGVLPYKADYKASDGYDYKNFAGSFRGANPVERAYSRVGNVSVQGAWRVTSVITETDESRRYFRAEGGVFGSGETGVKNAEALELDLAEKARKDVLVVFESVSKVPTEMVMRSPEEVVRNKLGVLLSKDDIEKAAHSLSCADAATTIYDNSLVVSFDDEGKAFLAVSAADPQKEAYLENGGYLVGGVSIGASYPQDASSEVSLTNSSATANIKLTRSVKWNFKNLPLSVK